MTPFVADAGVFVEDDVDFLLRPWLLINSWCKNECIPAEEIANMTRSITPSRLPAPSLDIASTASISSA